VCKDCRKQSNETDTDLDGFALPPNIDCECHDMNANVVAKSLARDIIEQEEQQIIEQATVMRNDSTEDGNNKTQKSYRGMQYGRQGVHGSTVMYRSEVVYSTSEQAHPDQTNATQIPMTQEQEVTKFEFDTTNQSPEPECISQSCEGQILMSLNDLDKSLTDVQKEIKDCLTKTSTSTGSESHNQSNQSDIRNSVELETHTEAKQCGVTFSPPAGEFSTKLIGDSGHEWDAVQSNVTVYQFVEKTVQSESHDSKSHDHSDQVNSGDITTYNVKMMSQQQSGEQPVPLTVSYLIYFGRGWRKCVRPFEVHVQNICANHS
jgi:hypothetical protein